MIVVLPVPEFPIISRLPYRSPCRCLKMATETNFERLLLTDDVGLQELVDFYWFHGAGL